MRLTDAEWQVMNAVWNRYHPASVRDILDELEGKKSWAYSTVKTILTRLVEKGALSSRLRANTTLYEPVLTRKEARRSALLSLADRAFGGTFGSLMQFLVNEERLSEKERHELKDLLVNSERENMKDDRPPR